MTLLLAATMLLRTAEGNPGTRALAALQGLDQLGLLLQPPASSEISFGLLALADHVVRKDELMFLDGALKERVMRLQPQVLLNLGNGTTVLRVGNKHHEEQVLDNIRHVFWEVEGGAHNILVEEVDVVTVRVCGVVIIRKVAGNHGVQDDTTRPNIDSGTDVETFCHDEFGCGITGGTTTCGHEVILVAFEAVSKTKVGDDNIAVLVEQEVFKLQVTVNNVLLVQVVDTRDELCEQTRRILLFEVTIGENVVKQLAACGGRKVSAWAVSRNDYYSPPANSSTMPMYFAVSMTSSMRTMFGCFNC
jgi:hypothetical protein